MKLFGHAIAVATTDPPQGPAALYRAITAPTLLMSGERSTPEARTVVDLLADAIPRATTRTFDAGHLAP